MALTDHMSEAANDFSVAPLAQHRQRALRALLVEDSEDDAQLLVRELRRGGFDPEFHRVDTAQAMIVALESQSWDIVFSDYVMPQFNGAAALEILKRSGRDIPFIIVSGTIGEDVAVVTMKAGAHDYVMKGNLTRLPSAVDRELREAEARRQRRQAVEQNREKSRRINLLHEINLAVTSSLDLDEMLKILLAKIDSILMDSASTIRLFDRTTGQLERTACRNVDERKWKAMERHDVAGLAQVVLNGRTALTVANVQTDPRNQASGFAREERLISYLGVPLIAKGEVLGLLSCYTRTAHYFTDDEIDFLLTLAGQAAIALYNAQLHAEINRQVAALKKSNQVKDEFLSVISHETRTPLNVAMGYVRLVKDGVLGAINAAQERALAKVLSQSGELLKMIEAILSAQSLAAGAPEVSCEPVSLEDLLDRLKEDYSTALNKDLELIWDYPDALPVLKTDGRKLRQILRNLLDNAIKFTDKGQVSLTARCHPDAVEFTVTDSGIGIAEEQLPFIFEKFRQVDSSDTRAYEGVGLGLYLVKRHAEMLGGTVEVESLPGAGSTFTVRIPFQYK